MQAFRVRSHAPGTLGFTLVELLIAISIVGVLLMATAPGFSNMVNNNRMVSAVYDLRATLNKARSEALTQRSFVIVCPSNDGASCTGDWNEGFIAFVDADGDGAVADTDDIFVASEKDDGTIDIGYSAAGNRVRFDSRGYASASAGTFTVCDARGPTAARGLIVAGIGSVRAAADNGDPVDSIVNDHAGDNLDCG